MVKLNYVNRKSVGTKLGQIVAKDLRKRTKPTVTSGKSDTHKDVTPIDLNLEGRVLMDQGIWEAVQGLDEVLNDTSGCVNTRLQTLNLAGNCLTVKALATLAPTIRAASADLEDLDLSNNVISVVFEEDEVHWQIFLEAFAECRALKRLNLSGNDLSGTKALEIFCKVYQTQFHRVEGHLDQYAEGDTDSAVELSLTSGLHDLAIQMPTEDHDQHVDHPNPESLICGLPCVQNIILANTSMTDAGALFLSYPLIQHTWAIGRLDKRSGSAAIHSSSTGIVYMPNAFTSVGTKLLMLAAATSHDPFESPESPPGPENSPVATADTTPESQSRKPAGSQRRRTSASTAMTDQLMAKASFHNQYNPQDELESFRRKCQRTVLEETGPAGVQLWKAALSMLNHIRHLLLSDSSAPDDGPKILMSRGDSGFATKLIVEAPPVQGSPGIIDGMSNEPVTPHVYRSRRRRDSISNGTALIPTRYGSGHAYHMSALHDSIRTADTDVRMIGPLPEPAWKIIIGMLADPEGVLNEIQKQAIYAYGVDRQTLAQEKELLGKPASIQVWRVLDAMGCLSYHENL